MARLSAGLGIAKAAAGDPIKQTRADQEKLVSPFTNLIDTAISEVEQKQKDKAEQLALDEKSMASIAENAALADAEEIDAGVQEIRDWEQQKIKDGVDITSLAYRTERRTKLANLQKNVAKSRQFAGFLENAKSTIDSTEYMRKGPAYMRMQDEMTKPLSERDYDAAAQEIISSPSMYDMNQYLTDVVANEQLVQDAVTEQGDEYITDKEVQYQKPFYNLDKAKGTLTYSMDPSWGINTLKNMPEWALGSINAQVEEGTDYYAQLQERVLSNDPDLTEEELIDWSQNGATYTTGSTLEKKLNVLEDMMKAKTQHEVNIVSKVMRDRAPTSKQTDTAKEQEFLNKRTAAIQSGNVEAIIQELNSDTYGNRYEKSFEWKNLGNGRYEIVYLSKRPLGSGIDMEVPQPQTIVVDTKNKVETKRQLGQLYNIGVTDISVEPPSPAAEEKKKKKVSWVK